jgi:hypothetical protein
MSNRNNRIPRIPILTENDRIILNIYLNMYNQTVRDIDLLYQNLSSIRNIIDIITGVTNNITEEQQREEEEPMNFFNTPPYRPSTSIYTNNNTTNMSDRFYLLSLARNILENYDQTYADVVANRTAGVRTRNRVGMRNSTSLFRNSTANGLSGSLFPNLNSFYENVPVHPTTEQILCGTRRVLYSDIEEEPLNSSCPITLERFESDSEVLQILGCKHIFSPTSLQHWFHNNVRCPVCRYDIREYNPHNRRSRYLFPTSMSDDDQEEEEETKEEDTLLHSTATSETSASSDSTLHTSPESPEPQPRNTIPEPTQDDEFISNLTTVTENLLTNLFSTSFPDSQFNFDGNTYSVDFSNNEIVFQGYIHPNNRNL